jgi:phosphopantothenoylcysteine decarboxylase / phosphopantothenate---cysteine ligase
MTAATPDCGRPVSYNQAMLKNRRVLLGVSGSIAAYKAVYLARRLVEAGAEVWPILTPSATRFVGPLTFSVLCGHRAIVDMWSASEGGEVSHVALAHAADLLLLAPATADLLARLSMGRAEDPLAAVALATHAPWIVAPAMESGMWASPATQGNVRTLEGRGARFIMPGSGPLASGAQGVGRMAEPDEILAAAFAALTTQDLAGQRVLVTAGPTREHFDPVRFISNPSTGKMGYALAAVARARGASVTLVTGPSALPPPYDVEVVRVGTAAEMFAACAARIGAVSVLIMAAAPADHRPAAVSPSKVKKATVGERYTVELTSTPDILLSLKDKLAGRVVVGFAAETEDVVAQAADKLSRKNLDLIVANDVTRADAGFGADTNCVSILDRDGGVERLPVLPKERVAERILDRVVKILAIRAV